MCTINPEGVKKNINPFDHGSALHTDIMKTEGLKQALDEHRFDVAFGGARRDEEKAEQKSVFFRLEIRPIGGTLRTNDRNCGMCTTVEKIKEKVYASSHSLIGQS